MLFFFRSTLFFIFSLAVFASPNPCSTNVTGYKILKSSVFPFAIDGKDPACFFAFYTTNPQPIIGTRGNGNEGDSLWYAYYRRTNPKKIYEFPKPDDNDWGLVCSLNAVSFVSMYGDNKRNVTIIGACDEQNAINYTFPFVFKWQNAHYVLDKKIYGNLFGFISLKISDIRNYIKSPATQQEFLRNRYAPN